MKVQRKRVNRQRKEAFKDRLIILGLLSNNNNLELIRDRKDAI